MADLQQAITVAEALAKLLHPFAEVVVHDIDGSRIAAIFNAMSKRKVGDDSMVEDAAGFDDGPDIHGPFVHRAFSGRRLKYSSIVFRNSSGRAIALMCVNLDVGPLEFVREAIDAFLGSSHDPTSLDTHFRDDWQERIQRFVQDYCRENETTKDRLTRGERVDLVEALQRAGAFRAKNAASFVANVLGVSRATIYNDLASAKPDS